MNRIITAVIFALWVQVAQAADLDKGTRAFESGDYNNARYELEPLAEAGDAQAQVLVGVMYALGSGYQKDLIQAFKWLTLSAGAGNEDARQSRERIASRMTRSQLRDAQAQADRFRPTPLSASSGSNAWSRPPDTLPSGRALVEEIQAGLSRLGYNPGAADGLMGQRTLTAIADFQRQFALAADTRATHKLLLAIRKAESDGLRASNPSPTARATVIPVSGSWYYTRQDVNEVLRSLRSLLSSQDDTTLRSGVTDLLQRSDWRWTDQVFRDDFKKSAGQGGLDWQVVRGEFSIRDGLLSDARARQNTAPPPTPSRKLSDKEEVLNILGALLGSQLKLDQSSQTGAAPQYQAEPDEVRLTTTAGEDFLLRIRILVQDPSGSTSFVLQRAVRAAREELRLHVDASAGQVRLEHATERGVRQIASLALRLESGRHYNFEWARTGDGLMQVALNGRVIISNARSNSGTGFDGFVWRNGGGSYLMSEVEMYTRRGR